jgi:acetyltransferase-like isoleucine patch superfamily enzyme
MDGTHIHALADVQTTRIGNNSRIWQFVVILPGASIGNDCNICSHCFIENDVVVGDRVTIKSGVQLWDGIRVGNDVFIGPNVTLTNDRLPRSGNRQFKVLETFIEDNASIGAGAVLLPGIRIGEGAMIAAGSVVTKNVPPGMLAMGVPARIVGDKLNDD